ncbi:glycosyltransferase family 1 protein [Rickettsiella endosymbiont of Aleochara curtula]|uniref:glycosyltransferase family 4 protein n=1 Tax=Rickettsiella endosymbiont of Aleochara curtula TaxID=3077936 RepID=UPI00313EE250
MNIIFNIQSLQYPLTGIGWYTRYLLKGLQEHECINQLICIPDFKKNNLIIKKNIISESNIKKIIKYFPGTYSVLNNYRNARFIKQTRFLVEDKFIYHEPCYVLKPYSGPKICTIHDLSHIHYSKYHPKERVRYLMRNLPITINNADHIITGSSFIRNELINYFKIPPYKITSIYHGVSKLFRPRSFNDVRNVLLHYNLHYKSYLLSVGTLEPRKNLERLIQAFSSLSEKQRKEYPLVLIGMKGWQSHRLEKMIQSLIKKGQLYCLGYIPETDLPYLYSGAYAFVYISIYEGFGLPLLEAMASGIPTLASSESAMPEVVGEAAMLVNPFDIDRITEQLNQLINNLTLRDRLKKLGPIQAAKFSWESCIESTIEVYKKTLNN